MCRGKKFKGRRLNMVKIKVKFIYHFNHDWSNMVEKLSIMINDFILMMKEGYVSKLVISW